MPVYTYTSIEVGHEIPVVGHGEELGVVEACVLVHSVDLGNIFVGEIDLRVGHVLSKARWLGRLHERDCLALDVPGKDDLGWSLTLRSGDLGDDRVCEWIQLHELVRSRLPVARADRRVALQIDAPFTVEDVDARLVEVGVDLDLVDGGLDLAAGNDIGELRQNAVAHAD